MGKTPAITANYAITLRWYNKPPLYLTARFGNKADAEQYAADFAKRQYAVDYTLEMIH
jgi:hypothetical protein